MSLSRKIAAALADRAAGSSSAGPLSAEAGPHRLSLDVDLASPIGVRCRSLEFSTTGRPDLSADALRAWAERISARLSYLMEPLRVVEVDAPEGSALVRSQSPTARDEARSYYEARLDRSNSLRLVRIAFDEADRRRRVVPFQLSGEVLERLADDLVTSVI